MNTVFVNNPIYNLSAGYTTHTSTSFKHDILNNYFVFGPASTGTDNTWFQIDKNQTIYSAGNLKDSNRDGALNGAATTPYWYQGTGTVLAARGRPRPASRRGWTPVGGPRGHVASGRRCREKVDALVISQVMTLGNGTAGTGAGTAGPDGGLYTTQTGTVFRTTATALLRGAPRRISTGRDAGRLGGGPHRVEPCRRRRHDQGARRLRAHRTLPETGWRRCTRRRRVAASTSTWPRTPPGSGRCRPGSSCPAPRTAPSRYRRTATPRDSRPRPGSTAWAHSPFRSPAATRPRSARRLAVLVGP